MKNGKPSAIFDDEHGASAEAQMAETLLHLRAMAIAKGPIETMAVAMGMSYAVAAFMKENGYQSHHKELRKQLAEFMASK